MYKINLDTVSDAQEFPCVPAGEYTARIIAVDERRTKNDDPMLALRMRIVGGEQDGRIIFDNVVLSKRAEGRLKVFLSALGFSGAVDVEPEMLHEKTVGIIVENTAYVDDAGNRKVKAGLPFKGYFEVGEDGQRAKPTVAADKLPF